MSDRIRRAPSRHVRHRGLGRGSARAVLARDRLGIKPLYYADGDDMLVFGSELKSVLASGLVRRELDYEAIEAYLTLGFVPGTAHASAASEAACPETASSSSGGACGRAVLELSASRTANRPRADEWRERLLRSSDESVRLRLMSDVPLGAMLSGGLDSSLIVALMAAE